MLRIAGEAGKGGGRRGNKDDKPGEEAESGLLRGFRSPRLGFTSVSRTNCGLWRPRSQDRRTDDRAWDDNGAFYLLYFNLRGFTPKGDDSMYSKWGALSFCRSSLPFVRGGSKFGPLTPDLTHPLMNSDA